MQLLRTGYVLNIAIDDSIEEAEGIIKRISAYCSICPFSPLNNPYNMINLAILLYYSTYNLVLK